MIIILATIELKFEIKKNKHIDIKLLLLNHMEKKTLFIFGLLAGRQIKFDILTSF